MTLQELDLKLRDIVLRVMGLPWSDDVHQIILALLAFRSDLMALNVVSEPDPPQVVRELPYAELRDKIREVCPGLTNLTTSSQPYQLTTRSEVERMIAWSRVDGLGFVYGKRVCVDFAQLLLCDFLRFDPWLWVPLGMLTTSTHAQNILVACESDADTALRVYLVEPQTDAVWEVTEVEDARKVAM